MVVRLFIVASTLAAVGYVWWIIEAVWGRLHDRWFSRR